MTTYTWVARDGAGKQVIKETTHETVEESKAAMLADGFTDLRLFGDAYSSAAREGFPKEMKIMGETVKVTAEDRIKHQIKYRNKPPPTHLYNLVNGLIQTKSYVTAILLVGVVSWYFNYAKGVGGAAVVLVAWMVFLVYLGAPTVLYHQLQVACEWHRWPEVMDIVQKLRKQAESHLIKIPADELARQQANALAATGDLEGALKEYGKYENDPKCPPFKYYAMLAGIYERARQHDKEIEFTLKSLSEKAEPTTYLDLAIRLARRRRDSRGSRAALAEAEKSTLPEIAAPYQAKCRGLIAYLEGDFPAARKELEEALHYMMQMPYLPGQDGNIAIARAYLACVLGKLGDTAAARKLYEQAKPYLTATGEQELMTVCQNTVGVV
jgi:tetratricopeptide (TPR) repeat protein